MEGYEPFGTALGMIVPYTYSFPPIAGSDFPREFRGRGDTHRLTDSIFMTDLEYYLVPYM